MTPANFLRLLSRRASLLALTLLLGFAASQPAALAQEPVLPPTSAPETSPPPPSTLDGDDITSENVTQAGEDESLAELIGGAICPAGECCPPSTQEKVMLGVGFLTLLVVLFFLLVRVFERSFIAQDRNSILGRHLGISLTVALTAAGTAGLAYWLTDCWHSSYWIGLSVIGAAWLIHLIYTLAIIRTS